MLPLNYQISSKYIYNALSMSSKFSIGSQIKTQVSHMKSIYLFSNAVLKRAPPQKSTKVYLRQHVSTTVFGHHQGKTSETKMLLEIF